MKLFSFKNFLKALLFLFSILVLVLVVTGISYWSIDNIQKKYAYKPPKKYNGSCLDGRDITYKILPDADFKFFLTANIKIRAKRRHKELKKLNKKIKYIDVLKSIKQRDQNDYKRNVSPLKITKDSILIDTTNLSIKSCFIKIKNIIDNGLKKNDV